MGSFEREVLWLGVGEWQAFGCDVIGNKEDVVLGMQGEELKSMLKDSFEQRERLCSEVGSVADAFMGPMYFLLLCVSGERGLKVLFVWAARRAAGESASGDIRAPAEGGEGAGGAWASDVGSGGGTEAAAGALGGG